MEDNKLNTKEKESFEVSLYKKYPSTREINKPHSGHTKGKFTYALLPLHDQTICGFSCDKHVE